MKKENLFKWKHYQPELILLIVRWYLRYNLSFRNLVEMMEERGLSIVHTTIMRWVHQYESQLEEKVRHHLKSTNDSWRFDETYIKVKDQWMYLYRAVDSEGNTIDFSLSKSRDKQAAKRFFKKALAFSYVSKPRLITVDKNPAYPVGGWAKTTKSELEQTQQHKQNNILYSMNVYDFYSTSFSSSRWIRNGTSFYRPQSVWVDAKYRTSGLGVAVYANGTFMGETVVWGAFDGGLDIPVGSKLVGYENYYSLKLNNHDGGTIYLNGGQVYYQ